MRTSNPTRIILFTAAVALAMSRSASWASPAADQTGNPTQSKTTELAHDDGASAGKRSIAGGGHAVKFEAGGKDRHLTGVRLYGSRYGQPTAPNENAYVWLCDSDFKLLTAFPVPYSAFPRGEAAWVNIPIKPTALPEKFVLAVGFNPTATKGVYVHHDAESSGHSLTGLPGRGSRPFEKGDWLIRVTVQEGAPVK